MQSEPRNEMRPIVVMHAIRRGATIPSYIQQLMDYSPPHVTHKTLNVRDVLLRKYDVLHIHWPEIMFRGQGKLQSLLRKVAFVVMWSLLLIRKTPIVRTMHNIVPHEPPTKFENLLLALLERITTVYVVLNHSTLAQSSADVVYIPHPHYKNDFDGMTDLSAHPGTLLYFGFIRPYKGVEQLVSSFREMGDPTLRLRVVGKPHSREIKEAVELLAKDDSRVQCRLEFVSDADSFLEFKRAELVVLPYRHADSNSGVTLLALSLGRPVLARASSLNDELAEEVGREWLIQFDDDLNADVLKLAAQKASSVLSDPTAPLPRLDDRDPEKVAGKYAAVYRSAMQSSKRNIRW